MQMSIPLVFQWMFLSVAAASQAASGSDATVYADHITWPYQAIVFEHVFESDDYGDNAGAYVAADCLSEQVFYNREKRRALRLFERRFNSESESVTQWVLASTAGACRPFDPEGDEIFAVMDGGNQFSDPAKGWGLYTTAAFDHYAVQLGGRLFQLTSVGILGKGVYVNRAADEYLAWWPEYSCWTLQHAWRFQLGRERWDFRRHSSGTEITSEWSELGPGVLVSIMSSESYLHALVSYGPVKICSVWQEGYCLLLRNELRTGYDFVVELFRNPSEWEESTIWRGAKWAVLSSGRGGYNIQSADVLRGTRLTTDVTPHGTSPMPTCIWCPPPATNDWVFTPIRTGIALAAFTIQAGSLSPSNPPNRIPDLWAERHAGKYLTAGDTAGQLFATKNYDSERALWTVVPLDW